MSASVACQAERNSQRRQLAPLSHIVHRVGDLDPTISATMSTIATQVGGSLELLDEAAALPSTKAATMPITRVTPNAPMKNQTRSGGVAR